MRFEPQMNANGREYLSPGSRVGGNPAIFVNWAPAFAGARKYLRSFAFICGFFLLATPARAEQVSMQGTLMVANVAGECEMLYSMVDFQKKNNIKGGEEYVAKFWAAEAAKMNISVDQLSDRCSKSTTAYDKLWDTFAAKGQGDTNGN